MVNAYYASRGRHTKNTSCSGWNVKSDIRSLRAAKKQARQNKDGKFAACAAAAYRAIESKFDIVPKDATELKLGGTDLECLPSMTPGRITYLYKMLGIYNIKSLYNDINKGLLYGLKGFGSGLIKRIDDEVWGQVSKYGLRNSKDPRISKTVAWSLAFSLALAGAAYVAADYLDDGKINGSIFAGASGEARSAKIVKDSSGVVKIYERGAGDYRTIDVNDTDSDDDCMPNWWEEANGLDPYSADAYDDEDGDGVSNLSEFTHYSDPRKEDTDGDGWLDPGEIEWGTDPCDSDTDDDGLPDNEYGLYGTSPLNPDSDGDGMSDGWEVNNGLNPKANDAEADSDADGFNNLDEYARGTDPNNYDASEDPIEGDKVVEEGVGDSSAGLSLYSWLGIAGGVFLSLSAIGVAGISYAQSKKNEVEVTETETLDDVLEGRAR
jgi:hypothetical protein